ncbi:MAG: cation:proton antiporter [Bacteroidales bacterium]|nr:cation:proton antiporter [Bacteroidales bacterium]
MSEELNLVRDLAVILVSAGVFAIISKALKQPLVLGYLIAGFLVGPNIDFFPGISSQEAVSQWSEIGVIFLMFALGLEFSFKKLLKVGSTALVTAGTKFLGTFILGFIVGQALSWSLMESIFLAGLLSMSSTTVVLKVYDDMGLKTKPYAGLVFGTLVVEDLIAILLMVLLSTLAVSNKFAGGEMLFNLAKLVFFLILWFLVGIYVIPTLLKKTKRWINDEILLLAAIGLCFLMVTLASAVGFSSALGAFVMGSILAETIESEHIMKIVSPLKDLFGAVFFVSVGMMISPAVIAQYWYIILILVILVYVSLIGFASAGVILTGKGLENAVHTGFSLASLGEFGFIIASVGVSLGVMREFIYPIIIAVSVITTFTAPYMIKLADPVYKLLNERLPAKWLAHLNPTEEMRTVAEQSEWKKLIKAYVLRIVLYGVVILAIAILSRIALEPALTKFFPDWSDFIHNLVTVGITLAVMAPFIYGLGVNSGSISQSAGKLLREKDSNKWPLLGLILLRAFLAVGVIAAVISSHFSLACWSIVLILVAGVLVFILARYFVRHNSSLESRFLANLNEKEEAEARKKPVSSSVQKKMGAYNVKIESLVVSQDCSYAGQKLGDIHFGLNTGANIIKIVRGSRSITIPGSNVMIFPGDELITVGTQEQLDAMRRMLSDAELPAPAGASSDADFTVMPIVLGPQSYLTGKTLRSCNLRDYHCMVISVLHGSEFTTNPKPDYIFEEGDTVWLAGEKSSCDWLR